MRLTYDAEADAAYLTVGADVLPGQASQQVHSISTPGGAGQINLDFDAQGRLLGVEVLHAASVLAEQAIASAEISP